MASDLSPLDSQDYFSSPLGTILESQNEIITLHDLAEAYALVSRRIRLCVPAIVRNERIYPAFNPFQAHSHSLTICITRDIGRCLLNPLSIALSESTSPDSLLIEEGAERGQAYATLSQHALVFLSDIFSFVPLTHAFSTSQLSQLVVQVLLILSAPCLPTPSSKKTWKLATWVLLSQNLQPDVWIPHRRVLKKVLLRLVLGTFDGHSFKTDGLRLFSALLRRSSSEFLPYLLHLFPKILSLSLEDAFDVKLLSLEVLRFTVALKIDSQNATWIQKLAFDTVAFVKAQYHSLQNILSSAMNNTGDAQWENKGPFWALLFTACLIYMTDFHLFTRPHSLKLIMPILAQAVDHKRTYVRALHPHLWKCLVWCYSRLPTNGDDEDPHMAAVRRSAFKLVKQELRGGIATALVALKSYCMIAKRDVVQVLQLIQETLDSSKESQICESIKLLGRILSAVGVPSNASRPLNDVKNFSEIVTRELFVGSLDLPGNQLRALSTRLPGPDERIVQPLTEDQIRENWKELIDLWVHAFDCARFPNIRFRQYKDQLMIIWKSLLLVQSHLSSGSDNMPLAISDHITSIVTNFIKQGNDGSTKTVEDSLQELDLVHGMWSTIKHSFAAAFLSSTAEITLINILLKGFELEDEGVKVAWSTLCTDLAYMVGNLKILIQAVFSEREGVGVQTQRQLWIVIANSELFKLQEQEWEDILSFLSLPLQLWSMETHELDVWIKLFSLALDLASASFGTSHDTLNVLLSKLSDVLCLKNYNVLLPLFLPHLHFNPSNTLHLEFLDIINGSLVKMYPPTSEDIVVALPILKGVARAIEGCESENIVEFLVILRDCLALWIRDEAQALLESDHSAVVRSIYCTSLTLLTTLSPSLHTLQVLSSFLSSSFERMGRPPIGPLTFEHYWRKGGFHDQDSDNFKKMIPEELKACLKAWSDYCDDSLAEGCTSVNSQSTARSFAPDSQSPNKAFILGSQDHESAISPSPGEAHAFGLIASSSGPVPGVLSDGRPIFKMPQEFIGGTNPQHRRRQTSSSPRKQVETVVRKKRSNSRVPTSRAAKRRRMDDAESALVAPFLEQPRTITSTLLSSRSFPDRMTPRLLVGPISPPTSELADVSTINSKCDENEIAHDSSQLDLDHQSSSVAHRESFFTNQSHPSSKRLQSEPVVDTRPPSCPSPLKRNHTTSERLGALERAYGLVADSRGASQVPLAELVHAAQITHKIGTKIAEQMSKKY